MSISQDQVVDYIKNLRLSEVKALIETLEKELGVSAAAPMMMGGFGPGAGAGPAAAEEEKEEQTEFAVILEDFGDKKIDVIKVIRKITGLGLKEAKEMTEAVPSTVKDAVDKAAAEGFKKELEEVGAKVRLK